MLVLHGLWLPPDGQPGADMGLPATGLRRARGLVTLWAEDSARPADAAANSRGSVADHPFAAPSAALAAVLGSTEIGVGPGAPDLRRAESGVTVALPTRAGVPIASPELVRTELEGGTARRTVQHWRVPAVHVPIRALRGPLGSAGSAVAAPSVLYLRQVLGFAADLVGRGRVLPVVRGDSAAWLPVLTGPDAAWARALAAAVPPALLAGGSTGAGTSPDDPVDAASASAAAAHAHPLVALLDGAVDAEVRARFGPVEAARRGPPEHERSGAAVPEPATAWLRALLGDDPLVAVAPAALATLQRSVERWQRDAVSGPARACFRLMEPDRPDEGSAAQQLDAARRRPRQPPDDSLWRLRFALQAADEPSLLVDAEAVWRSSGPLTALARHVDQPQETFLAELGRAARLYPALTGALRTSRPDELTLTTVGAHDFLKSAAPLLSSAGFGVLLPNWWNAPPAKLGLTLKASTPTQPGRVDGGQSAVGFAAIAEYRYELAVGEATLTDAEIAELAALKAPLVRIRGQWVEVDPRRLAAGLARVAESGSMRVGDLLEISAGLGPAGDDALPVTSVQADGWLAELLSGSGDRPIREIDVPPQFSGALRPYQRRGLNWLAFLDDAGLGGVLADDMGLGKTVQLLALLARHHAGADQPPTLLVCPMSLVGNWHREAAKFAPTLRIHVHHGSDRARGRRFADAVAESDVVLTTYALAARDAASLRELPWSRVVLDEAQAIKNASTKQSQAIRTVPAPTRIAMTGTPVENRLADLWSILDFVNPGMLGTAGRFRERFALPIERHGDEDAAERLRAYTAPFVLRRLKTDRSIITDLPEKLEMDVVCNLTGEQASLYQAVVDDMLAKIESSDGIERRGLVLATMTKLKQVCNHPAQFLRDGTVLAGRSGKLARLEEIVEEVLAGGERALLFTQYAEFGGMLRAHLAQRFGREVLFLHGGVPKAERDRMVERFQRPEGGPSVFVLSLKAGGTGLTLTAANHVVHVDRWWNPAVEDQATDRAFRIGQRRSVQVRKFVCAGTVEEKIAGMIAEKRGLAARIVGSGEGWITELSTGELRELFRLEREAVVE